MAWKFPLFWPADFALHDIRQGLAENDLECTICSVIPRGLSMISDDAFVRQKTRVHLEDCVKAAAEVGAKIIAGPLYSPVGYLPGRRRTADEWKWAVECYQSLGPVLARARCDHRDRAAQSLRDLLPEYRRRRCGALRPDQPPECRDSVRHVPRQHRGEEISRQAYRTVARHLKHVHTCENDRGIPGSGHVEWKDVFQALRDIHYDGWLTIESFGFALGELSARGLDLARYRTYAGVDRIRRREVLEAEHGDRGQII